ncbi:MAG: deoxyhypusine synthase family protein [Longimicrobiales bacterium]|nr:deoxyhypusine synthase family protein [Longimicrobiales bacterium]
MGHIRQFMRRHYLHFNAKETRMAAEAYCDHLDRGGQMLVTLAGAMSTGELGISLARMIREKKVHAISCTGANLEEDIFNLMAHEEYEVIDNWRGLSSEQEERLYDRGMNRVTDTCIPENVMRHLEGVLVDAWQSACDSGERKFPSEFLFQALRTPGMVDGFQINPEDSWVLAAMEAEIPVYTPGWEDSTMGNIFVANVVKGRVNSHLCVKSGTEQFQHLLEWYVERTTENDPFFSLGLFQIGGGIAGDFAICAAPCILQDLKEHVPTWGYFAQITDAVSSYGGYSGAVPEEKITWGKITRTTPCFSINSDASIVAPLVFSYILDD